MKTVTRQYLDRLLSVYPMLTGCQDDILLAFNVLLQCYQSGNKVLICGNGGSAADAEHIVGELMKGFTLRRTLDSAKRSALAAVCGSDGAFIADHLQGALPAISLVSHSALITAYANDVHADMIFAQQVYGYGKKGDVLIGLSTSGNSKNVVYAIKTARAFGITTIGMTGAAGGKMAGECSVLIRVPAQSPYEVQEFHQPVYHALCAMIEVELFEQ